MWVKTYIYLDFFNQYYSFTLFEADYNLNEISTFYVIRIVSVKWLSKKKKKKTRSKICMLMTTLCNKNIEIITSENVILELTKWWKLYKTNDDMWHRKFRYLCSEIEVLEAIRNTMIKPKEINTRQDRVMMKHTKLAIKIFVYVSLCWLALIMILLTTKNVNAIFFC